MKQVPTLAVAVMLRAVAPLWAQARLPEVRISARTTCEIHPETAAATAELWLDASAALLSASAVDSLPPTLLVQHWRRTLTSKLRLRWEERDTARITTRQPFSHNPPGNLERIGYIQASRLALTFYGPGADLILSERFLRQHCFRRLPGAGPSTGLVGLAFEPLPTQERPDVSGVLWIDPELHLLRHIEYTWTNPPLDARAPALGGRTDFVRLADGGWIVQRWNIRMPRPTDIPGTGYDGYTEQGGEVLARGVHPRVRP